ncbi:MAG: VOC family protein [Chloroflexi bacterium]|nr:VOC family protein [Chloroflexota bacterium]
MNFAQGIHHITAIGSDPQRLIDFYTGVLGLRLVKKTVNQDDVSAYHLFFGDETGEPGMDLTFFTFPHAGPGSRGRGQVTNISLAVPKESLTFWLDRFEQFEVRNEGISKLFDWERIIFFDFDDQRLELVGVPAEELSVSPYFWTTNEISAQQAIRHFHSALMTVTNKASVESILSEALGYQAVQTDANMTLYHHDGLQRAAYLQVEEAPSQAMGYNAVGTVHHIAFAAENEAIQNELRDRVIQLGLHPTQVIDRFYFKSVYFRIPAGILFEIATMGPGFTADENEAELGQKLSLPPFLEGYRGRIEPNLVPVSVKQPQ